MKPNIPVLTILLALSAVNGIKAQDKYQFTTVEFFENKAATRDVFISVAADEQAPNWGEQQEAVKVPSDNKAAVKFMKRMCCKTAGTFTALHKTASGYSYNARRRRTDEPVQASNALEQVLKTWDKNERGIG